VGQEKLRGLGNPLDIGVVANVLSSPIGSGLQFGMLTHLKIKEYCIFFILVFMLLDRVGQISEIRRAEWNRKGGRATQTPHFNH